MDGFILNYSAIVVAIVVVIIVVDYAKISKCDSIIILFPVLMIFYEVK